MPRLFTSFSLFVLLSAASATAQAQTPGPTGTPPPPQPGPGPEITRPPVRGAYFDEPMLVPTFGVDVGFPNRWASSEGTPARAGLGTSVPIWGGVAVHPAPSFASGWVAFGAEASLRSGPEERGTVVDWVPEMRVGTSITGERHPKWQNLVGAPVEVYTIAGWRVTSHGRSNAFRTGVGISSPALLLLVAEAARDSCVPPPNTFEAVWDFEPQHQHEFTFRLGWSF